jgi:hypothetical protein
VCGLALCAVLAIARPAGSDADHITLSIRAEMDLTRSMGAEPPRTAYENDVRRIARVFDDLELPLPERITVRLYRSADLLTRGLEEDVGLTPSLATIIGQFAAGVALDETLLVLEPEFQRGPRAWLRLMAHEMAHLAQSELADGRGCGPQWLAEGMADWVAFTVLDRLGVARMTAETGSLLVLDREDFATDRIDEPRRFLEHARDVGAHRLYRFAFRLVHHLIERHGFDAVVGYFRACPSRTAERQRVSDLERDVLHAMRSGSLPRIGVLR